jgi:hypothetical protein
MVIITFYPICQEFFNYCIQKFEMNRTPYNPAILNARSSIKNILLFQKKRYLDKIRDRVVRLSQMGHQDRIGYKIDSL